MGWDGKERSIDTLSRTEGNIIGEIDCERRSYDVYKLLMIYCVVNIDVVNVLSSKNLSSTLSALPHLPHPRPDIPFTVHPSVIT
jgi:hypothetical protein